MKRFLPLLVLPALCAVAHAEEKKAIPVRVVKTESTYELQREGKPYFIKGAGGEKFLDKLAAAGGNSIRTWGPDRLDTLLDEAHKQGLTVTVGIWLGHERHGFNYNDADQVSEQYERARKIIERYKDHPAVLLWGIGNEMEGYANGDNAAIWSAVNNIATLAKKLDPNHPTMTVVAEIGGDRVKNIHRLCPDLDIVGINSYGGAATLPERYRKAGGTKPYIVTEFGPAGSWETKKNAFGAFTELTSTEKAERYKTVYRSAIEGAKGQCLGSYAFLWGNKQEATATWFGMLLPDGTRLGAVDALTECWTGKAPKNRCPSIESLTLSGSGEVDPGATVKAELKASDPEGDPLTVRWVLQREPFAYGAGGDAEEVPPTFADAILKSDTKGAEVRLPKDGGGYRLFAYVTDGQGGGAVANVPLRVKGETPLPKARRAELPLIIYDEANREKPAYIPAGWMGNAKALRLNPECADNPHAGKTCIRVEYRGKEGWGGIIWQNPPGDWGDVPGGFDLSGAKTLTFWARGEQGGEAVTFLLGVLGKEKKFADSASAKLDAIKLTKEWKEYRIDLSGKDLARIKTAFGFSLAAQGQGVVFYLDDIKVE